MALTPKYVSNLLASSEAIQASLTSIIERLDVIEKQNRNKKKFLTTISGLDKYGRPNKNYDHSTDELCSSLGLNVKDVAKKFGKKFACGSSVIDNNAIEIQGDIVYELQ